MSQDNGEHAGLRRGVTKLAFRKLTQMYTVVEGGQSSRVWGQDMVSDRGEVGG